MLTESEYNKDNVVYCERCLSLNILRLSPVDPNNPDNSVCYCDSCNSTELKSSTLEDWDTLYYQKYGVRLLDQKRASKKPRRSVIDNELNF